MTFIKKKVYTEYLPTPSKEGVVMVNHVLVQDHENGLFQVRSSTGDESWTAAFGLPRTFAQARMYFPNLKEEHYYERKEVQANG